MPVFYRIVRTDPPTPQDLLSLEALGRTPRNLTPYQRRLAGGISVFDTPAAAMQMARQLQGRLGWYLAELSFPNGDPTAPAYQLTGANGHFTLWGSPAVLLAAVTRVLPIAPTTGV